MTNREKIEAWNWVLHAMEYTKAQIVTTSEQKTAYRKARKVVLDARDAVVVDMLWGVVKATQIEPKATDRKVSPKG